MPGKPNSWYVDNLTARGTYYPGSKEYRAWDEGYRYRYGGTAASRPKADNPYTAIQTKLPAEFAAWNYGWDWANQNTAGTREMPNVVAGPVPENGSP